MWVKFLKRFNIKGVDKSAVAIGLIAIVVIIGSSFIDSKLLDLIIYFLILIFYIVIKVRMGRKKWIL